MESGAITHSPEVEVTTETFAGNAPENAAARKLSGIKTFKLAFFIPSGLSGTYNIISQLELNQQLTAYSFAENGFGTLAVGKYVTDHESIGWLYN